MITLALQGPLGDPRVIQALFGMPLMPHEAEIDGVRLVGGEVPVPGLARAAGDVAQVLLVTPDGPQATRMQGLAAALGLVAHPVAVTHSETPMAVLYAPAEPDSAPWVEPAGGWAPILVEALKEISGALEHSSPDRIAARLGTVLQRADTQVRAATTPGKFAASGLTLRDVRMVERTRPYAEFFAVDELVFSHPRFDGTTHPPVTRAVFMAADAVTVLPYDPVRDRVLLVEQVRAGPIARGDQTAWLLEPVAGRIEPGHTPEETARKEAAEEAGLTLGELHFIGSYYPTTGCVSEYLYSYVAVADLPDGAAKLAGVAAEGEDIRGHVMPRTELLRRIENDEIPDGPLLLSVYWLEYHLARIRDV